jgi:hypothetical protein
VSRAEIEKVLHEIADAESLEEGRRLAKISELSDRLKARFYAKCGENDGAKDET